MVGGHPEPYMLLHVALGAPQTKPNEHPTPQEVFEAHQRWFDRQRQLRENAHPGELVVKELFDSALRELEEELGLSKDMILGEPSVDRGAPGPSALLLGMFTPNWVRGKIDIVFLVNTNITFAQLSSIYNKGMHQDAFEHDALIGFTEAQARAWLSGIDESVAAGVQLKGQSNMSPYCRATLDIYMRVLEQRPHK